MVNEGKAVALGEEGVPDDHRVVQRKLAAQQKPHPSAASRCAAREKEETRVSSVVQEKAEAGGEGMEEMPCDTHSP